MYTGTQLIAMGLTEGPHIPSAIEAANTLAVDHTPAEIKALLVEAFTSPDLFEEHDVLGPMARKVLEARANAPLELREKGIPFEVFGAENIEAGAMDQMHVASKLPVAEAGALMPDAHQGYGLPIGGVLATKNAIIPYAVGVDIGCRMCLSVYEISPDVLHEQEASLTKMLERNTAFGRKTMRRAQDHDVLHNPLFGELEILRGLKERAKTQIGSSGGGNHFVEFGVVEITDYSEDLDLQPGTYLALLSHSGSRGMGAGVAKHYTQLAMAECKLPQEARHLAWLDLDSELGQEYWLAMNLAGDYASACHHQIHERMAVGLRTNPKVMVENHHNFAWKELDANGEELIVHRKGATPAGEGVLGVIPGSMTAPGFIVRGKGHAGSVNSASHGAGRAMSRTKAKNTLDQEQVTAHLEAAGVKVIGSGLDEAPMAYKDIHTVMACQEDLVDVLGTFMPKIVRMCGDKGFFEVD